MLKMTPPLSPFCHCPRLSFVLILILWFTAVLCASPLNGRRHPILKLPVNKTLEQILAKKNSWPLNDSSSVIFDTNGVFDINGMPAYAITAFSEALPGEDIHLLTFETNGRQFWGKLGTSNDFQELTLEKFDLITQDNIYLYLFYQETGDNLSEKGITGIQRLYIIRFIPGKSAHFICHKIPVTVRISESESFNLQVDIESDSYIDVSPLKEAVHPSQKKLLGKFKLQ